MTTHTTTTRDRPAEKPWPIDRFNPRSGAGHRQRVLVEAEVYDDPDPDDDNPATRYYTLSITTGNVHTNGRELVSIREDHVRAIVHRIPEPAAPALTMPARLLTG